MPRPASARKKAFQIVAGSPALIADMFDIGNHDLAKAFDQGLPVYKVGVRHRILVEDVVTWFRTLPRLTKRIIPHAND